MIYKTVYGEFKGKYIEAKGGVYWLTEPIIHRGMGYALLYKTYRGSYEVIKILRSITTKSREETSIKTQ